MSATHTSYDEGHEDGFEAGAASVRQQFARDDVARAVWEALEPYLGMRTDANSSVGYDVYEVPAIRIHKSSRRPLGEEK